MRPIILVAFIILVRQARAQDVPFYTRDTKQNTDLGGLNQNSSDLAKRPTDRLTTTLGPKSCAANSALVGAQYTKSGTSAGGTCQAVPVLNAAGTVTLPNKTIAQLLAITPVKGDPYFCTDCSPAKIVVATGTAAGNFADAVGGAFK